MTRRNTHEHENRVLSTKKEKMGGSATVNRT